MCSRLDSEGRTVYDVQAFAKLSAQPPLGLLKPARYHRCSPHRHPHAAWLCVPSLVYSQLLPEAKGDAPRRCFRRRATYSTEKGLLTLKCDPRSKRLQVDHLSRSSLIPFTPTHLHLHPNPRLFILDSCSAFCHLFYSIIIFSLDFFYYYFILIFASHHYPAPRYTHANTLQLSRARLDAHHIQKGRRRDIRSYHTTLILRRIATRANNHSHPQPQPRAQPKPQF